MLATPATPRLPDPTHALRIHPSPEGLFVIGDTARLVVQILGGDSVAPPPRVIFELRSDGKKLKTLERDVGSDPFIVEHMPLSDLAGGDYQIAATLVSASGETVSSTVAPLRLSPRSFAARPGLVYRRGVDTRFPGLVSFLRGEQLLNLGHQDEAIAALEDAVASGSDQAVQLVPARWTLANAYLQQERADDALALLRPLEATFSEQYEVMAGLGFAFYLKGDHTHAVDYFSRARALAPPDTMLLNALGDGYQTLGRFDEAREAFERSLVLDSEQPNVEKRLESLAQEPESLGDRGR